MVGVFNVYFTCLLGIFLFFVQTRSLYPRQVVLVSCNESNTQVPRALELPCLFQVESHIHTLSLTLYRSTPVVITTPPLSSYLPHMYPVFVQSAVYYIPSVYFHIMDLFIILITSIIDIVTPIDVSIS